MTDNQVKLLFVIAIYFCIGFWYQKYLQHRKLTDKKVEK
jgi:hypothetical protein